MGVLADTFWRTPGVLRSDSPHAFAAIGPQAARITADHPIDVPHGLNSPVGARLRARWADPDARRWTRREYHRASRRSAGGSAVPPPEIRHDHARRAGQCAAVTTRSIIVVTTSISLTEWLDAEKRQRRGRVGHGEARLAGSRDVVEAVRARLRANETVFLHEPGVDIECDEARASIGCMRT